MRKLILAVLFGLGVPIGAGLLPAQDPSLTKAQSSFEDWVRLQQAIADEKSDWAVEKEYLNAEIRLLQEEIAALEEREKKLKEETTGIEAELQALETEIAVLDGAANLVKDKLPGFEESLRELRNSMPGSLLGSEAIQTLFRQVPEAGVTNRPGVGGSMAVVVTLLGQLDKFNSQLSVSPELVKNAAGENVQVQVLYLGLAQAWFVNNDDTFAGTGKPAANGWEWSIEPGLAPVVRRAIRISENAEPATYVGLPASVN